MTEVEPERPGVVKLDFEKYTFLADKGPLTSIGLLDDTPDTLYFNTLRVMALKKGFSCMSGLKGYYFVNNYGEEEGEAAQGHSLPAILYPADEGSAPVFGLRWKVGANGSIYAMCIPTDLKQSTDNDGVDKWLTDKDVVPRRLDLFKSIEPIENRDGHPLAKKFDVWIKDHSDYFKELKMKSLASTRAWLSHGGFNKQFRIVYTIAEAAIRAEVKASCGEAVARAKKKSKSSAAIDPTTAAEINRRISLLDLAVIPLRAYVANIAVPLGYRIIEIDFGFKDDVVGFDEIERTLRIVSHSSKADALVEILKTSDKVKLLANGEASIDAQSSPLPSPCKPAATPRAAAAGEASASGADWGDVEEFEVRDTELLKRKRSPPVPLSPEPTTKGKGTAKKPVLVDVESKPEKRAYKKTGIHSRDPIVSAAARLATRTPDQKKAGECTIQLPLVPASSVHSVGRMSAPACDLSTHALACFACHV